MTSVSGPAGPVKTLLEYRCILNSKTKLSNMSRPSTRALLVLLWLPTLLAAFPSDNRAAGNVTSHAILQDSANASCANLGSKPKTRHRKRQATEADSVSLTEMVESFFYASASSGRIGTMRDGWVPAFLAFVLDECERDERQILRKCKQTIPYILGQGGDVVVATASIRPGVRLHDLYNVWLWAFQHVDFVALGRNQIRVSHWSRWQRWTPWLRTPSYEIRVWTQNEAPSGTDIRVTIRTLKRDGKTYWTPPSLEPNSLLNCIAPGEMRVRVMQPLNFPFREMNAPEVIQKMNDEVHDPSEAVDATT